MTLPHYAKKALKYSIYTLLGLLFLVTFLLATPWGTGLTIAGINTVDGINISHKQGSFAKDLHLNSVDVTLPNISMQIELLQLDWQLLCVAVGNICIDNLSYNKLNVTLTPGDTIEETQPPSEPITELIALPLDINIDKINLNNTSVNLAGTQIALANFSGQVKASQSKVRITKPTLNNLNVTLAENSTTAAPAAKATTKKTPWPLANLPAIYIPLDVEVNQFAINQFNFTQGELQENLSRVAFSAKAKEHQVSVNNLIINHNVIADVNLNLTAKLVDNFPLSLNLKVNAKHIAQYPEIDNSTINLDVSGNLDQLLVQLNSSGALELSSNINLALSNETIPFELTLNASKIPLPAHVSDTITPATIQISAQGDMQNQQLSMAAGFSAFGYNDARFNTRITHNNKNVQIEQLQLSDKLAKNNLSITGDMNYQEQVTWNINLSSDGFTLPNVDPNFSGRMQGTLSSNGFWHDNLWQINLTNTNLHGIVNELPALITGEIAVNQDIILLPSKLLITLNETDINLAGYSDENWHIDGKITVADLGNWLPESEGSANIQLTVGDKIKTPTIKLNGNLSNIALPGVSTDSVVFSGEYIPMENTDNAELRAIHQLSMVVNVAETLLEELTLANTELVINANLSKQAVAINSEPSKEQLGLNLALNGFLSDEKDNWQGELSQFKVNSPFGNWHLVSGIDADINIKEQSAKISSHCWQGPDSNLCLQPQVISADAGELQATLTSKLNTLTKPFLRDSAFTVHSQLDADIVVNWQKQQPPMVNADIKLGAGNVLFTESGQTLDWTDSEITAKLVQQKLSLAIGLNQLAKSILTGSVKLNLADEKQLSGNVIIDKFNINQVLGFAPTLNKLEGDIDANITLGGTATSPTMSGHLHVKNTSVGITGNPTEVKDVNINVALNNQSATLDGSLGLGDGAAKLSGQGSWENNKPSLNLRINGEKLTVLHPPKTYASVSPNLSIDLQDKDLSITGKIVIDEGLLQVKELPPSSTSPSDDIVFIDKNGQRVIKESSLNTSLAVDILIKDGFAIDAMGFEGEVGGNLSLAQQPAKPLQLFGNLNIIQGFYEGYGQALTVEDGQVLFNGPTNNPYINIKAARIIEDQDVTAGIHIQGPVKAITLKFYSDPLFDQNEILSYIVRGRGIDSETGESNPMAMLVGTGISSSQGVFKQLEKIPLLSNIEVDTQGEGNETQATISGYVGDRIYLKYGVGVFEPINELTMRLYILNRLWLETVSGLESSVDLYYSFEIEGEEFEQAEKASMQRQMKDKEE